MNFFRFLIIIAAFNLSPNVISMSIDNSDKEVSSKLFSMYPDWQSHGKEEFLDLLTKYYAINPSKALSIIDYISQNIINGQINLYSNAISFLAILNDIDSNRFESLAKYILDNKLYSFTLGLFEKPESINRFDNSKLSLDEVLDRVKVLISTEQSGEASNVLKTIALSGREYHARYRDKIVAIINTIPNESLNIGIGLSYIESTDKSIQDASFDLLLRVICSMRALTLDFLSIEAVKDLLKLAEIAYTEKNDASYYEKMYTSFKQSNSYHALLILWFKLFSVDPELFRKIINDYFKLDEPPFKDMTWNDLMNLVLLKTLKQQNIPEKNIVALIQILLLDKEFSFTMSDELDIECIGDLFDTAVAANLYKELFKKYKKSLSVDKICALDENVGQSSNSNLKKYVKYLHDEVNASSSYDLFAAQASIIALGKLLPDLDTSPVDEMPAPRAFYTENNTTYQNSNFTNIINADTGIMYGLLREDGWRSLNPIFRLYAFDDKTGYAIWKAPFTSNALMPFAIDENYVYIPSEKSKIAQIDKYLGDKKSVKYFGIPEIKEIKDIRVIDKILYISSLEKVLAIDTVSGAVLYSNEMPSAEIKSFFSVNGKLIVLGNSSIMIYDKTGLLHSINTNNELPYKSKIYVKNNTLYFTSRVNEVISLNSVDLTTYDVQANLSTEILNSLKE